MKKRDFSKFQFEDLFSFKPAFIGDTYSFLIVVNVTDVVWI